MKQHGVYQSVEECADDLIKNIGKEIVLGLPLGLGKPNQFVNELFRRALHDPSINLTICTALSLEKPNWSSDLERRFLEPFVERMFGGVVDLEYIKAMRENALPDNIKVKEFYTKAGSYLNLKHAQQNYISSNYTHVFRDLLDAGVNVLAQMVCSKTINGEKKISLSCNPDVSLDVARELLKHQKQGKKIAFIGQINNKLPFMYGDAIVDPNSFTAIIENPDYETRLFGAPKMAISDPDFMIGLYASTLIKDGGTLQIGIGSLGDALVHSLQLRHDQNDVYSQVLEATETVDKFGETINCCGGTAPFKDGLSGCTEMLVDGYIHLMNSGIIKRKTYNHIGLQRLLNEGKINEKVDRSTLETLIEEGIVSAKLTRDDFNFLQQFGIFRKECRWGGDGTIACSANPIPCDLDDKDNLEIVSRFALGTKLDRGILIYGGFFLGPESFYRTLNSMSEDERKLIFMTSVLRINHLYENEYASEELKVLQRAYGRFVNACLMVTLNGGVVSDGLDSGQMVSGVGGQYNFVSQAHALPNGRSILMCRSTRVKNREIKSNIVYNYGHITVPRHLRDIIITEYGIANLRSKSDHEIIEALLNITDSRFQDELLKRAKESGKISESYEIPPQYRNNYPERIAELLGTFKKQGFFQPFPFGTDFTQEELKIGKALKTLKARMSEGIKKMSSLGRAATIVSIPENADIYLKRLDLHEPTNAKEKMMRKLVVHALDIAGVL